MTETSPAYLWYPKDMMSSGRVSALSALEELWYRRALDQSWLHVGMPADPKEFAGWVGRRCTSAAAAKIIEQFFRYRVKGTEKVFNDKQEKLRKQFKEKSRLRKEAGRRSGVKRRKQRDLKLEQSSNKARTKTNIPFASPSPSPSSFEEVDATAQAVHIGTVIAGVAEILGVQKLSRTQEKQFEDHANLAFINGFSSEQFLACYRDLRNTKNYHIKAEYVTDRLPEFTPKRERKPTMTARDFAREAEAQQAEAIQ